MPSILDIGLGKVGSNSHPIHPATVHMPITFLLTASFLDILSYVSITSPTVLSPLAKLVTDSSFAPDTIALTYHLSLFSYASNVAGILTSFPALSSGLFEAYAMISAKGLDLSNPVIKTMLIHAGLNDLAVIGAIYNWLSKRNAEGFVPNKGNVLVSGLMLGSVMYSALLGGGLVYTHGTGVQRMGKGKEEKEEKEEKDQDINEQKEQEKKEL